MKTTIPQTYRTSLLQQPTATPILVCLEKSADTALAMRVADLFSFRREGLPITARAIGYQGKEGTWVVTVAFRIAGTAVAPLEGVAYANPRYEDDLHLLQSLATQERLPFLFLSPHLKVVIQQEATWSVHHRQEVRLLLAQVAHAQTNKRLAGDEDLDFDRARKEFQELYSVSTLLAAQPRKDIRMPSPFRGVVLE
ncbi:MAG TPA: hypothetical protein VGX03_39565 [Candidatus Binatia bacterium]|jgi:hypothetical protein|nr:hypothetical protein [Candidatus Binatia bacterium]